MAGDRHHDSAICHLATMLVTRIATCMRAGQRYQLRDIDGTAITESQGRVIIKQRYQLDPASATTPATNSCTSAAIRPARRHRSRQALQHPSPLNPSLRRAHKWPDFS
ncbi:hypothetical protein I552_3841 [Mycobacterium xenopi 3993]|nr:hypothetical protein I552_3841 [Mycobacterium xenopi 3993]